MASANGTYHNVTVDIAYTLSLFYINPFVADPVKALHFARTERQSAQMSKIKNAGLDQYGAEPFEQQQFGTACVEGVNRNLYFRMKGSK